MAVRMFLFQSLPVTLQLIPEAQASLPPTVPPSPAGTPGSSHSFFWCFLQFGLLLGHLQALRTRICSSPHMMWMTFILPIPTRFPFLIVQDPLWKWVQVGSMISQWPTEQVLPMQLGHHVVPSCIVSTLSGTLFDGICTLRVQLPWKMNKHGLNSASGPQNSNPQQSLQHVVFFSIWNYTACCCYFCSHGRPHETNQFPYSIHFSSLSGPSFTDVKPVLCVISHLWIYFCLDKSRLFTALGLTSEIAIIWNTWVSPWLWSYSAEFCRGSLVVAQLLGCERRHYVAMEISSAQGLSCTLSVVGQNRSDTLWYI